mgnify:CR=1 FL=1
MTNLETMHQKALVEYENKNLDEALTKGENLVLDIAGADIEDLRFEYSKNKKDLIIYLEKDDKFNYYLARANVNIAQNKLEYAISDTKKALELNQEDLSARRKLARLYKVDGKNLKAIDEFLKLLEYLGIKPIVENCVNCKNKTDERTTWRYQKCRLQT